MLSNVKRTQASAQWEHLLNNVVLRRILVHASLLHWHFLKAEHVFLPGLTDGLIDLIDSCARCTLSQVATWPLKLLKLLLGFVKIVLCMYILPFAKENQAGCTLSRVAICQLDLLKLLLGFVKVVTWIHQSCSMYFLPFAKQTKLKFGQNFKASWIICPVLKVKVKVLNA